MEENRNVNNNNDERLSADDDQLRMKTTNEVIREASGDPDTDLNQVGGSGRDNMNTDSRSGSDEYSNSDVAPGVGYNPNDMSATRSGGLTDMDDQTAGGAGLNSGERLGSGSNLTTRRTITGSDFDGQDKTS